MNKSSFLLALALTATACIATIPDASAQGRARGRAVVANGQGGTTAVAGAAGSSAKGKYARGRKVATDAEGNVQGLSGAAVQGANGGEAVRQGSFYRNADGSAGRQGSAYANGPNGGSASTSGSVARDTDGNVNGSRNTSATGASGNNYTGSTTATDGQVSHTGACTNAAGEPIACPTRGN